MTRVYLFRHTTTSTLCSVAILIEVMMTTIIERYYGVGDGEDIGMLKIELRVQLLPLALHTSAVVC